MDEKARKLVDLVKKTFPDWKNFQNERFVHEEVVYKQELVKLAEKLLNADEFDKLITEGQYDELIKRLESVGGKKNLLFLAAPTKGDLSILYQEGLDKAAFCQRVRGLLYGSEPAPERLEAYARWVESNKLPNKWTFPTYFLFLTHPESLMFVKPRTTQWFFEFMGRSSSWPGKPSKEAYSELLKMCEGLKVSLQEYDPKDMIDIQSAIWVGYQKNKAEGHPPPPDTSKPGNNDESSPTSLVYPLTQLAADTNIAEEVLPSWVNAIERKGQAILYGPPGTGKTFIAEHLARFLVSEGDGFCKLVQFHPAYAYEDFIQGIRPKNNPDGSLTYEMAPGRFLEFCEQAGKRKGTCVLIIDEINRANLARVFGELMYLLEYRESTIPLAGGVTFGIPENVRIIGTMNTADRSIALVDHALRRRFAFLELEPRWDTLRKFHQNRKNGIKIDRLIEILEKINREIGDKHYAIGISFFLREDLDHQIRDIWYMEIIPYLEEYFFDQPGKVDLFRWEKVSSDLAK